MVLPEHSAQNPELQQTGRARAIHERKGFAISWDGINRLGAVLRERRTHLGLTLSQVAERVEVVSLPREVPVINRVKAGYPTEFTDLGYPARVADEYVRVPDLEDADAFGARVVGDSMEPDYREGDVVVFSPKAAVSSGSDCFVRLEPDQESTFKRVYFEQDPNGRELIRLQPLNNSYPPVVVPRERVAGLYSGVSVVRSLMGRR